MKFHAATSFLLLASTAATTTAFTPASSTRVGGVSTTSLYATVEKSATTGKLIPPLSPSEICDEQGRVSALYDGNVQKTYG